MYIKNYMDQKIVINNENILVLAPHPDDEALGCSGLIMQLPSVKTYIAYITNGEKLNGTPSIAIGQKRMQEAILSAKTLKSEYFFLNFPDGTIGKNKILVEKAIEELILKIKPAFVLSPSPIDHHSDHLATSYIAFRLYKKLKIFNLLYYEVYSTSRFNLLVNISDYAKAKHALIMGYHTSLYNKPERYARSVLGINAHRAIFSHPYVEYLEAYVKVRETWSLENVCDYLSYKEFTTVL